MFKKINAFLAALTITATAAGMLPANAENNYSAPTANEQQTLPSKVDLSSDYEINLLFPEIKNQGYWGSCTSFATVYYQFSYEARKAYFNKYGVVPNLEFSPAYTYTHLNGGENKGTSIPGTYDFIKEHGALPWALDPYSATYSNLNNRVTDAKKLCESLRVRLNGYNYRYVNYDYAGQIEAAISYIKNNLSEGKVVVTSGNFNYHLKRNDVDANYPEKAYRGTVIKDYAKNEPIEYAFVQGIRRDDEREKEENREGTHAFTIVGYDDDIVIKYGDKELKGAFKIANSWDKTYGNKGFMWIAYDAFYPESKEGITCTTSNYLRVPAFSHYSYNGVDKENNYNGWFYTIDVDIADVKLIAEADIKTNSLEDINLYTQNTNDDLSRTSYGFMRNVKHDDKVDKDISYEGSVVQNINSLCTDDYFSGKSYYISVNNSAYKPTTVNSVSLRDDLGNVVASAPVENGANGAYVQLNLQRGDINYDGEVNAADRDLLLEYVESKRYYRSATTKFSTLQRELMDVNRDGEINDNDLSEDVFFWTEDGKYKSPDGALYRGWQYINNGYYFLDYSGTKVTSNFMYDADYNGTFYLNENGLCVTNSLFSVNGKRYYADENGYIIKNSEVAVQDGGKTRVFYFNEAGEAVFGWSADRTKYYSEAGMYTGTHIIDGVSYTFDDNGVLINA